uniref:Uncharacterized protein n=1 Tax=Rhodopseudomonas palustris (strain DX-1) TaxID=652103 RepID=E6VGI9_RHOPX
MDPLGFLFAIWAGIKAVTLGLAISGAGLVLIASLVVGYIPFGTRLPVIGPYVIPARFIAFFGFGALASLVTLQLAGDACEAQRAADRAAAEKARVTRDREIRADLEGDYRPRLAHLADQAKALQKKVDDYAKHPPAAAAARPKAAAGGNVCRLGDAAYRLRPQQR